MKNKKRVRKKGFNLAEKYRKCLNYIKESRNYIYFAIGIFLLLFIIGFFIPAPEPVYNQILDYMKEILEYAKGLSLPELTWFIFSNNVRSTLFGMFLGAFFGIFPIMSAVANGYLLGFVSAISVSVGGISSLWKLFPHGIFEIPAIFISLGLGMKLGFWAIFEPIKYFFGERKKKFREVMKKNFEEFVINAKNSLLTFLLVIVPLLIIAGIIESVLFFFVK